MLRATYLFVFGIIVTLASLAFSQETSINNALKVSRRTGKPIFAIASRKVCGPCQILKSRVAKVFQNREIADQVVYLRVDLDDASWKQWSRKFPHQGRMLPIVYLIRSDERQMYGRSNTLPGDQLEKFLQQGVAHCGTSFNPKQIETLETANLSISSALESNQLDAAVSWVQIVKQMGIPGKLNSFAEAAVKNNQLIALFATKSKQFVQSELNKIKKDLEGDSEAQFRGVYKYVELQDAFGDFEIVSNEFSDVAVKLAVSPELRKLWALGSEVFAANKTLASASSDKQKAAANKSLIEIEKSDAPRIAKLAATEVKRRHAAILASLPQTQSK